MTKNNPPAEKYPSRIPILSNTHYDLAKFDFSVADIRIIDIHTETFTQYILELNNNELVNEENLRFIDQLRKDKIAEYQTFYAVVPASRVKYVSYAELEKVYSLLLVIFPSNLEVTHEIDITVLEEHLRVTAYSSWPNKMHLTATDEYLLTIDEKLPEINEFIRLVFKRIDVKNYIGLALYHYLTSFQSGYLHYGYVSLLMALETIVDGHQELSYRLKRNLAILLGTTDERSQTIFDNMGKIYKLRSDIVHGGIFDRKLINQYIPMLRALVSRMIIELLVIDEPDLSLLNKKLTASGFGDRNKLNSPYQKFTLNADTQIALLKSLTSPPNDKKKK